MSSIISNINISRNGLNISSRFLHCFFIAIAILLIFRTFQYFPGMHVITELSFALAFLLMVFIYAIWKLQARWQFTLFELYVLAIGILLPFYSGIMAWREFGQPVIYGILAERGIILSSGVLILISALRRGVVRISDLDSVLVGLGWGCLFLYLFMYMSLDPRFFSGYGKGFVDGAGSDMKFKFHLEFINFAFFYYAFVGFRKKSIFHYTLSAAFLLFILLGSHRSLLVSMLAAFAFFVWRWSNFERLVRFLPYTIVVSAFVLGLLYLGDASYMATLYSKFADAFTVILTGHQTQDPSANARILETITAIPYIEKHWLLGNGMISHQWHGGYEKVIGDYFYPADIGIVGVMYMYGIFGTLLFACQFLFALHYSRRISKRVPSFPLLDATKGFLLCIAIHSLITGEFVHNSSISLFFVALLACIAYMPVNLFMIRYPMKATSGNLVDYAR